MSLIPTIYSSTDPGAPVLTGLAGSGLSLLRALLVNGYGSGVDTKAGLGWTEPFSGTNKAVFRNNPTSGSGYRLRVDATLTRALRMRAYATMTTVDAGTGPTPTTTQRSAGSIWPTSTAASSAPRRWWAIGNERAFYLWVWVADDVEFPNDGIAYFAGDIVSLKPGDAHAFAVSGSESTSYAGDPYMTQSRLFTGDYPVMNVGEQLYCGLHIARGYAGTGGSIGLATTQPTPPAAFYGALGVPYPYPLNAGMVWQPAFVHEAAGIWRGTLPGLVVPLHQQPFADLTPLSGLVGMPAGESWLAKRFTGVAAGYGASYGGQVLFRLGQPWE